MEIIHTPVDTTDNLTPREIVEKLDEYIIGQVDAKRAVAVAIRNRWRRAQLDPEMRREVMPKNILMVGPTGVGKTEVARRLADLVKAPFLKVEASKYTEVGYHGRDAESMVRDLAKIALGQVRQRAMEQVAESAKNLAEDRVLNELLPPMAPPHGGTTPSHPAGGEAEGETVSAEERRKRTREKLRQQLRAGDLDGRMVEISAPAAAPMAGVFGAMGGEDMAMEMQEMISQIMPSRRKTRRVRVADALRIYVQEESEKLLDDEAISREGLELAEQRGIIFIDEIDKVIGSGRSEGPDVSREGVQRDLLPIVEGCSVATKYGVVKTDHILFIAAGAFHGKKPSDLIPELQGRFPIRVELKALDKQDYLRILTHPKNALTKQYELLLGAEAVRVTFTPASLEAMADFTARVNRTTQDIGARRLHTIMERLFEELSFNAPDLRGQSIDITHEMVKDKLQSIVEDENLSRFVL